MRSSFILTLVGMSLWACGPADGTTAVETGLVNARDDQRPPVDKNPTDQDEDPTPESPPTSVPSKAPTRLRAELPFCSSLVPSTHACGKGVCKVLVTDQRGAVHGLDAQGNVLETFRPKGAFQNGAKLVGVTHDSGGSGFFISNTDGLWVKVDWSGRAQTCYTPTALLQPGTARGIDFFRGSLRAVGIMATISDKGTLAAGRKATFAWGLDVTDSNHWTYAFSGPHWGGAFSYEGVQGRWVTEQVEPKVTALHHFKWTGVGDGLETVEQHVFPGVVARGLALSGSTMLLVDAESDTALELKRAPMSLTEVRRIPLPKGALDISLR